MRCGYHAGNDSSAHGKRIVEALSRSGLHSIATVMLAGEIRDTKLSMAGDGPPQEYGFPSKGVGLNAGNTHDVDLRLCV